MEREYDGRVDGRDGFFAAIAELRRRGLIAGKFQPINDEERAIVERAREERMKERTLHMTAAAEAALDVIRRAAKKGAPAPKDRDIARELGASEQSVRQLVRRAEANGLVCREVRSQKFRRFILPDGRATDWTDHGDHFTPNCRSMSEQSNAERWERLVAKVYAVLEAEARNDRPLPTIATIARMAGIGHGSAYRAIDRLARCGRIERRGVRFRSPTYIKLLESGLVLQPAPAREQMSARAALIAAIEAREPTPTITEIARRAVVSPGVVSRAIAAMTEAGALKVEGRGRMIRYVLPSGAATVSLASLPKPPRPAKPRKAAHVWKVKTPDDMAEARTAMHERAQRVETVAVPLTADDERAAMLAAFLARGGKPMKCPDGFAVVRNIHEMLAA